ncbi:methylated-DNA--[protein]-cysteine S-methyltransferase [Alkalibacillus almallahensis]|uniref:methylated-DNA--[protein]-cysteine S-methyltransferase n=1 Tax=Alkalibacillus almallahensis TaxID=1379154 RepID=UPI001422A0ED|nr:methylated-DNA--[protein]-cysteine S-methyltransferase [Alkalibacillus almallahensis]NIK13099.1 O-6-methylguanine DNA methyltransferase [Alkalibacillus almallahensis]
MTVYVTEYQSPVGPLFIGGTEDALYWVKYGTEHDLRDRFDRWLNQHFGNETFVSNAEVLSSVTDQLDQYFQGNLTDFDLNFVFYGTTFQQEVWQALLTIPYGETWSYLDIAQAIGRPKAVRAVGGAVNRNPFTVVVPCHRVIGKDGSLVGYGGGLDKKKTLLSIEMDSDSTLLHNML